uniref:WD_REPEATS_REGION domain-containing protein n=1 Tax=Steinernema glaseri TaxID=37863 RepID=A0A1I7XYD1_9BILA
MNHLNSQFSNLNLAPKQKRQALKARQPTLPGCEVTSSGKKKVTGIGEGDRYIPHRNDDQLEYANHLLSGAASFLQESINPLNTSMSAPSSPVKQNTREADIKKKLMRVKSLGDINSLNLDDDNIMEGRIMAYKKGVAPQAPSGYRNQPLVRYSSINPSSSVKKQTRRVTSTAERILDAPGLIDDFYLSLTDWSAQNILAVSLGDSVFLWNAETADIECLFELDEHNSNYVTSVKWSADGFFLAVGLSDGCTKLFDASQKTCLRTFKSQTSRIGTLTWNKHILSCGSRTGEIYNHDVRHAQHLISKFSTHRQEVCGLDWDGDGLRLASGGGDGLVCVWDVRYMSTNTSSPLHVLNEHTSTVKAVKFCPFRTNILVTGGGAQDRNVKVWSVANGNLLRTVETGSQVTGILFNNDFQEMVTSHGMPDHVLKVWKYNTMQVIGELKGHSDRILNICQSPCNQFIISASSDETLRLWHTWKMDESVRRQMHSDVPRKRTVLDKEMSIR